MGTEIWLCDLCYTQQIVSAEVMPAAIGSIASYCDCYVDGVENVRVFKYPEKLIQAMQFGAPNILGFGNYCWNLELSYGFAQVFKKKYPDTVLVMGGPNYPIDELSQEQFLRDRPAINFYVLKEGELPFRKLVEALIENDFDIDAVKRLRLSNIHAITSDDAFVFGPLLDRINDLTEIPSAYLTGKMDEFFDGKLMPILQTNRGCPFTCTYCMEGNSYFNTVYRKDGETVAAEIDYIGRKMAESRAFGGRNDLFIADSNFGMFQEDLETCRQIARARDLYGWPEYVKVGTGKNRKQRVLEAANIIDGAISLAGSVQSTDPEVLANIKRSNVDVGQLLELATESKKIGANSYAEVILALPGDSVEKHLHTIETLIDAGFTNVYMFQLMMLPGSELTAPKPRERHKMSTHWRVIPRCFGAYDVNGERVVTAEIEEITTSLDTLSFDDYLYCRRFNLIVTIFYNDSVFAGLLKLLQHLEISRYRWVKAIADVSFTGALAKLIDSFLKETRRELWTTREDLAAFTRKPDNIKRYLNDELGGNLIFKYQALAMNDHLRELAEVARSTILEVLKDEKRREPKIETFVDDILTYEVLRRLGIFKAYYDPYYADLEHDVEAFLTAANEVSWCDFIFEKPRKHKFYLDQEQISMIERSLNTYGRTTVGMTRILARVHFKTLLRRTIVEPE